MMTVYEVIDIRIINVNYLENPVIFSNTATTAIMFPVAQSILEQFETSKMSASGHDDKTGLCFLRRVFLADRWAQYRPEYHTSHPNAYE